MSFYLHQEKLAEHIDGIEAQIRQVRQLKSMLLRLPVEDDQYRLVTDSVRKLNQLESGLSKLVQVLEHHSDDVRLYLHQLDQELEVITHQIDRLFI